MTTAAERRTRIRVPVQSKIRHSQYQVLGTPVFQENSSIDLSSNGIAFETEREYQKGNLVLLEVKVEDEELKLLVCVAWVKPKATPGLFEVGAELIAVDPVHKRKMQKHLNRLISEVQKKKELGKKKKASKKAAVALSAAKKTVLKKKSSSKKGLLGAKKVASNKKTVSRKKATAKKSL